MAWQHTPCSMSKYSADRLCILAWHPAGCQQSSLLFRKLCRRTEQAGPAHLATCPSAILTCCGPSAAEHLAVCIWRARSPPAICMPSRQAGVLTKQTQCQALVAICSSFEACMDAPNAFPATCNELRSGVPSLLSKSSVSWAWLTCSPVMHTSITSEHASPAKLGWLVQR